VDYHTAKDAAYAQKAEYASAATPRASKLAVTESMMSDNMQSLESLVTRIERLADRLCGSMPEEASGRCEPGLSGNGMLDVLQSYQSVIARRLAAAHDLFTRMESDLG
jgi:hypothetical protein